MAFVTAGAGPALSPVDLTECCLMEVKCCPLTLRVLTSLYPPSTPPKHTHTHRPPSHFYPSHLNFFFPLHIPASICIRLPWEPLVLPRNPRPPALSEYTLESQGLPCSPPFSRSVSVSAFLSPPLQSDVLSPQVALDVTTAGSLLQDDFRVKFATSAAFMLTSTLFLSLF